jgi:hypothetical protein
MEEGIPTIRRYGAGDRLHIQAQQIWLILAAFVSGPTRKPTDEKTMTYGELAELMGYSDRRAGHTLSRQLGIIGQYCLLNELPALNAIVVTQNTGVPGDEVVLSDGRTVKQEQKAVMAQDWLQLGVPTTGTLRKVWASMNV